MIRSPAPALVVATPVVAGEEVEEGAPVLVLESMKMETVLRAPFRALVRECLALIGTQVTSGAPLLRLEPLPDRDAAAGVGAPVAGAVDPGEQAIDLPAMVGSGSRGSWPTRTCGTCAACCSGSTAMPTTATSCSPATSTPAPS